MCSEGDPELSAPPGTPEEHGRITRILIALDASPHSMAGLKAAVELAARLDAELVGIFVEDVNLVRMAGLQVTIEVGETTGRMRPIDERRIAHELRGQANRVRRALQRAALGRQVRWSFEVVRGLIDQEVLALAEAADLVIVGRTGWSATGELGSTAAKLLAAAPVHTLLIDAGHRLHPTLMAVYDGSEAAIQALHTASDLARQLDRYLVVGVLARDHASARDLQSQAAGLLSGWGMAARFRWLIGIDSRGVGEMLGSGDDCVLVLPESSPLFAGQTVEQVLQHLHCPVLILR